MFWGFSGVAEAIGNPQLAREHSGALGHAADDWSGFVDFERIAIAREVSVVRSMHFAEVQKVQ